MLHDKDPNSTLDYVIDWEDWLGADTITDSTWVATAGITIDDGDQFTDTTATVWLSGGTDRATYLVTNHITTAAGRQEDRTLTIRMFAQ